MDSLPFPTLVLDRNGRILGMNPMWSRFASAMGEPFAGLQTQSDYLETCGRLHDQPAGEASSWPRAMRALLAGERSELRSEWEWPGGRGRYLIIAAPLLSGSGAVLSFIELSVNHCLEDDLRKRAAESAAIARQLREINRELDQFAYITSHDLKAPLRGIANLSRWIEEDMGDRITAETHEQMELLRGRVNRMESLINGMLQYSRVGRVFTYIETIDVNRLLAEVIDLLSPPPRFRVQIEGPMPVVRGERLRLQQVFMNLIGNAIKHHHRPDGRVTISTEDAGAFWRFSVSDDGPGIAPRFHEKIFVIFQTLVPRDQKEAAGVGLSLVRKIVEEQGGTVSVQSEEGAGATFRFTWAKHRTEQLHPWAIDD